MNISKTLPLVIFLAIALFPFGWLGEVSPEWDRFLSALFKNDYWHAAGHAVIFFILGWLIIRLKPEWTERKHCFFLAILGSALAQEAIQLCYKQRALVFDDFRDIVVDISAASLALMLYKRLQTRPAPDTVPTADALPLPATEASSVPATEASPAASPESF